MQFFLAIQEKILSISMKVDLKKANQLIADIARKNKYITPVTKKDYDLFQSFFDKEPHTYGNSWTYVTQGVYGIGPENLGYKYYDGKNLSMVCVYPKIEQPDLHVFYWIRPMGSTVLDVISDFSHDLLAQQKIPTYVKKIFKEQFDYLRSKGFTDTKQFPWYSACSSEDDTLPEKIINVNETLTKVLKVKKEDKIKRSFQYYRNFLTNNAITIDSIFKNKKEAKNILKLFFSKSKNSNNLKKNISKPEDFYNLIENPAKYSNIIENLFFAKDIGLGFFIIQIQNKKYASLYATITLRNIINHLSDFIIFYALKNLQEKNIEYLNLGGSETKSLDNFKNKFLPDLSLKMYWASLY